MKQLLALLVVLALSSPAIARAHGREASLGQVEFHSTDHQHIVVRATWGFIQSHDGGETWTWQCASAVPFDRVREDPPIALTPSHALVAGTFDGITRSDDAQCAWAVPATAPSMAYVTDVLRDPSDADSIWVIASPGVTPDALHRSDDQGLTWSVISMPHPSALTDKIRVGTSDPMRVYTSGVIPRTDTEPRAGVLLRSDDRGATFRLIPVPLVDEERTVHVLAVDPTNADRLWVRAVRRNTDLVPERILLSEDGGETWTTALEAIEVVGFAISDDGQRLWAGSWDGGLYRSIDRGLTFTALDPALRVRCLSWRAGEAAGDPDELWVCADGFGTGYALGRSFDGGDTVEPVWSFRTIVNDVGCPAGTPVGDECPMYWPDLTYDFQLDAGVPPDGAVVSDGGVAMDGAVDGGTATAGGGGCACRASGGGRDGGLGALGLGLAILVNVVRRSRHRSSR